jgi:cation transport ATPase
MASQKQRRRRAKEKRHEYDLVEIDAEGNETVLTASEVKSESPPRSPAKKTQSKGEAKSRSRRGTPQPPSWRRVLKRGAIFAPIFLATVLLLAGNRLSFAGAVVQTLFLLAVFVPFSYFMDRLVWRSYEKRQARSAAK